ncbi:type I methionyl aminopeptidase [Maricaulis salignorans]|uniref:Methionine aminopeptidase n=1 Tax=Maricaulis salignorans TaxID=144026 RepID=A0A1G9TYL7_9PROT|nr:methionine aminopeptidase, type I [Maricaulis salignorans]
MTTAYDSIADYDAPSPRDGRIKLHGAEGFEGMRKAGRLGAQVLDMLVPHVQAGVTTEHLDRLTREFVLDHGATPATLHYRGYRHSLCTSLNHVVCHGIPGPKPLRDDDILNIDVTVIVDGWHGDTSRMYTAGQPKRKAERLIDITYEAMMAGIEAVKPGVTLGTIGAIIQDYAEERRCSVVRDFCGHGLGQLFHDSPNVLHFGTRGEGPVLKEGMFFTIEPMLNLGRPDVKVLNDGWTAVTRDKSLSAQFEHSIGVTADGHEIFTQSPKGLDKPPYNI